MTHVFFCACWSDGENNDPALRGWIAKNCPRVIHDLLKALEIYHNSHARMSVTAAAVITLRSTSFEPPFVSMQRLTWSQLVKVGGFPRGECMF